MHEDSCIGINYAHMFPKCFRSLHTLLGFALYFVSSIQLLSLYPFIHFWPVREFLVEIHTAKTGLLRCCLYTSRRLQQNKKNRESRSSEVLSKDGSKRVSPFYHVALHASSFIDFLWIIMNYTRNHSIATNWRKNSMIGAIADTSRMAWAWVVVLQILGVDGLMWTTLRWSQNDFSMVQCFQTYWERSTNYVCIENILLASCSGRNSCP